jgi:hypothetical protein
MRRFKEWIEPNIEHPIYLPELFKALKCFFTNIRYWMIARLCVAEHAAIAQAMVC